MPLHTRIIHTGVRRIIQTRTSNFRQTVRVISTTKTPTPTASSTARSLSFLEPPSSSSGDDNQNDLDKWQKMYDENAPSTGGGGGGGQYSYSNTIKSEIRVVTFDLDNTIWKTSNVINAANDALAAHLDDIGIHTPIRVEKVMGTLFNKNKARYSPILVEEAFASHKIDDANDANDNDDSLMKVLDDIKTPVLLTQLRIDALKEVLKNQTNLDGSIINNNNNNNNDDDDDQIIKNLAQQGFDVWTKARHDAIPHNLAACVIECLDQVRSLKTSYGKSIVVGAITDGNSDPRRVDLLKDYFDFCVNAESVGISKPDRRVYDAAILHVYSNPELQHVFFDDGNIDDNAGGNAEVTNDNGNGNDNDNDNHRDEVDCNVLFETMKDKWIHIGDDFMKDIVGAKDLKMRSVWCTELVKGKQQPFVSKEKDVVNGDGGKSINDNNTQDEGIKSTLTKELNEKKVVNMIIGSEDFLLDSIQAEFADAIVDEFQHVGQVLTEWHLEGIAHMSDENESEIEGIISQEVKDLFTVIVPDDPVTEVKEEDPTTDSTQETMNVNETKFCIMCGTKLPKMAKFCSSCGEKQP